MINNRIWKNVGGGGGGRDRCAPSKSALAACTILDGFFPNLTQMSTTMRGCVKGQGHRGHSIFAVGPGGILVYHGSTFFFDSASMCGTKKSNWISNKQFCYHVTNQYASCTCKGIFYLYRDLWKLGLQTFWVSQLHLVRLTINHWKVSLNLVPRW